MKPKEEKILHALQECNFTEMWKGKELDDFYEFLSSQAIPAQGFLITVPMVLEGGDEETGWVWLRYEIRNVETGKRSSRVEFRGYPEVAVPTEEEGLRECPEEWKGLPVWRLNC